MNEDPQTAQFVAELERVINRFRSEYDLTLATAVGVLHILAFELIQEASDNHE